MKDKVNEASAILRMMSHPERLMILCQLVENEMNVSQLQENSQLSQSAFSQHLSVLKKQGLISSRKEALKVFYRLEDANVKTLITCLHALYCQPEQ